MEKFTCMICYEDDVQNVGEYACGHQFCMKCVLVRFITQKLHICPICKVDNKQANKCVIHSLQQKINQRLIHQYKKYDGLFYQQEAKNQIDQIMQPNCPKCNKPFDSFKQMVQHAKNVENIQYCQICVHSRPCLPIDQVQYNEKTIRNHLQTHPMCLVCHKRLFDQQSLDTHLLTDHCRCELCANRGVTDSFWLDTQALFLHYRQEHYQCKYCSSQEFTIAFSTEKELLQHQLSDHITQMNQKQIQDIRNKITELNKENISLNDVIRLKELYSLKHRQNNKKNHQQQKRQVDEFGQYIFSAVIESDESEESTMNNIQMNIEHQQTPQLAEITLRQSRPYEGPAITVIQGKAKGRKQKKYFSAYDYIKQNRGETDQHIENEEYEDKQDHKNDDYYDTHNTEQQKLVNYIKMDNKAKESTEQIQNNESFQFDDSGMFSVKKAKNRSKKNEKFYAYENNKQNNVSVDERLNADEYFQGSVVDQKVERQQRNEITIKIDSDSRNVVSKQEQRYESDNESSDDQTGLIITKSKRKNKQKSKFSAYEHNLNNRQEHIEPQEEEPQQESKQPIHQPAIKPIDFGQVPNKQQFKVYVEQQQTSQDNKQDLSDKHVVIINAQTYGKLANELCVILSKNDAIMLSLIINFKYSDEFLQNRNFDQKMLQKQAKNQGIPPFKKQSYQQVQEDQNRYLIKSENDFDQIQQMMVKILEGKLKKLQKLSQQKIDGIELKVLSKDGENISDFKPEVIYVQQNQQEYDFTSTFISQCLKISGIKTHKFSDFWTKHELEKHLNNLDVYFKRQYCPLHALTKPNRCAYDWTVRAIQMLNQ